MEQVPPTPLEDSASATPRPVIFDPLGESGDMSRTEATAIIMGLISTAALAAIFFARQVPEPEPTNEPTVMDMLREKYPSIFGENNEKMPDTKVTLPSR